MVIQPAWRTFTTQARLFLERFEAEVTHVHETGDEAIAVPKSRWAKSAAGIKPA